MGYRQVAVIMMKHPIITLENASRYIRYYQLQEAYILIAQARGRCTDERMNAEVWVRLRHSERQERSVITVPVSISAVNGGWAYVDSLIGVRIFPPATLVSWSQQIFMCVNVDFVVESSTARLLLAHHEQFVGFES